MFKLLHLLKKIGHYIPFTVYFIVFGAISIGGYIFLNKMTKLPDSAYKDIFSLLLYVVLLFCITITCFGFITVFASWLYFKLQQRKGTIELNLKTISSESFDHNKQLISIKIKPFFTPLLGFVRIRLLYDGTHFSDKVSLRSHKSTPFNFSFEGDFNWNLPEIREYHIEKVMIYFEDFFQFFSIMSSMETNNRFYIHPSNKEIDQIYTNPRKTEDMTIRIDELKRVEGELINYKNFENNDDVRRIVWKIYAKNKELVVRIPEILDPYASHVYLYTSFHSNFKTKDNEVVNAPFLNYYKTVCWSIYTQLAQKGFEVRFIPDQAIAPNAISEESEKIKYVISTSSWQYDTPVKEFVKPGYASVLVVSSLNDLEEVKEFAENFGSDISIVFVPLTESLKSKDVMDWIKWIFVESDTKRLASYRASWNLSPLRSKINENEEKIAEILKQAGKATTIEA